MTDVAQTTAAAPPLEKKWWILGLGLPVLVWADLYTKALIVDKVTVYDRLPVIEGYFDLFHTRNRGAAFGLFNNLSPALSLVFFWVVTIVALGILSYLFWHIREGQNFLAVTVTFILGGAAGNFVDRLRYGYVVDFLDFYVEPAAWPNLYKWLTSAMGTAHWPTFNVADVWISVGATMLIIYSLFLEPKERAAAEKQAA